MKQIEKIILILHCIECGFKKFEAIDKEELKDLLKSLKYV